MFSGETEATEQAKKQFEASATSTGTLFATMFCSQSRIRYWWRCRNVKPPFGLVSGLRFIAEQRVNYVNVLQKVNSVVISSYSKNFLHEVVQNIARVLTLSGLCTSRSDIPRLTHYARAALLKRNNITKQPDIQKRRHTTM